MSSRYPEPRAGRFTPPGEQRDTTGMYEASPHAGGYPERGPVEENQPPARGQFPSYGWIEEFIFTLPAGTAFVEAGRFSGLPDSVHVTTTGGVADIRLSQRGGPQSSTINITDQQKHELYATGEVVFARDPGGTGGTVIYCTGRFAARGSEPRRALPAARTQGA